MALEWNWKEPCGYAVVDDENGGTDKLTLYKGNSFLLFMLESEVDYFLIGFWLDKNHAKNCLGLNKGYTRWSLNIREITLYPSRCEWIDISKLLVKAYPEININIRPLPKGGNEDEPGA